MVGASPHGLAAVQKPRHENPTGGGSTACCKRWWWLGPWDAPTMFTRQARASVLGVSTRTEATTIDIV